MALIGFTFTKNNTIFEVADLGGPKYVLRKVLLILGFIIRGKYSSFQLLCSLLLSKNYATHGFYFCLGCCAEVP